ncbi:MAG: GAF domain-containing protein [Hydrococcus sp. Prado102]|jgi:methyl-accepting chemotaxis protein PixJ|nr:GAF domain-containing protein [Hydrococcus sp. Prado102]
MTQPSAPEPGQSKDTTRSQSDLNENSIQETISAKTEPSGSAEEKSAPKPDITQSLQPKQAKIDSEIPPIEAKKTSQNPTNQSLPQNKKPVIAIEIPPKTEIERLSPKEQQQSRSRSVRPAQSHSELKSLTIATAIALTMLPVLAVGTLTYIFGNNAITKQIEEARRSGATRLADVELTQQRQLLGKLLLGTGITALAAGSIAWFCAKRTLRSAAAVMVADSGTLLERQEGGFGSESPLLVDLISQIHTVKGQEILDVAVDGVRRILKCDRVLFYSREEATQGTIIAESVAPNWTKALGQVIDDPCFEAWYDEKYKNGRVQALENIHEAGLSECYIKELSKLSIKATLTAPVISEGKLISLLIAHQCDRSRLWQPAEIELFTHIAKQVGLALDRAKHLANYEALQQRVDSETQWMRFYTETIQHRTSLTEKALLKATVEEIRKILDCDRVLFYSREDETQGIVIAESVVPGLPRALGQVIQDPCFEAWYNEKYKNGRVQALENIYESGLSPCYIEQLAKLSIQATLTAPVVVEGNLLSLLIAHQCDRSRAWQPSEIALFTQMAKHVSVAIGNVRFASDYEKLQKKVENEIQQTQFFTEATKHIRTSLAEKDILETAIEEVRKVLKCDRVVVYSQEQNSQGVVIAESVASGWPRAMNQTIEDPCFQINYIEKYENGRVKALDNIYEGGMTPCYIEQLEKLAVKANLVAPILNEGKLLGLLIAHQCSAPRIWQQTEIRWFAQIAMQVGFAIDNARLVANTISLQQQNDNETRWTEFFTDATQYIRASLKEKDVLEAATKEVRRFLECDRVVVYSLEAETMGVVIAESVAPGWPKALGRKIVDPCFEAKYLEQYQNGRIRAFESIYTSGLTQCYIETLERLSVKANMVAPILSEGKILGLLVAHQCSQTRAWQQTEIRWFAQVSMQVGFAIDNARLIANYNALQEQSDNDARWTRLLTDTTQNIRATLKERDVLDATVESVRKVLECDRVVVYSREKSSRGLIIAESVAPGWPKAIGRIIQDPCFEAKYDEQYRDGRVRAFESIYTADLSQCYIQTLERLSVKANLVAPILNEGNLIGLLVAHQCRDTRTWRQMEIRWFAQIAIQAGFAIEQARLLELAKQAYQKAESSAREQRQHKDLLQRLVTELLKESQIALTTLSTESQRQQEAIATVIDQIQTMADSAWMMVANTQQVEMQMQKTHQTVRAGHESVNLTENSLSAIGAVVGDSATKVKQLGQFSQKISQVIRLVNDLAGQMNQQSMNVAIAAGRSRSAGQESVVVLAETVRSLAQQLVEVAAQLDPLVSEIETGAERLATGIESSTQQVVVSAAQMMGEIRQKLTQIDSINTQLSTQVKGLAQAANQGAQTLTFANQSIPEMGSLASQTSEQAIAAAETFFTKLEAFARELQAIAD